MEVEEMQNTLGVCCDNYNIIRTTYLFSTQRLTAKEAVPYMLALYQVVTLSHVHVDEVKMVKVS